tara:strand:+ start:3142 stop:3474 length:333 start_codon:yes stop_codon:yes gene_type:complete
MSKSKLDELRDRARQEENPTELEELPFVEASMLRKNDRHYDGELLSRKTSGGRAYFAVTIPGKGRHGVTTFPNKVPKGLEVGGEAIVTLDVSEPKKGYETGLVFVAKVTA